jgi:hypothetical protein
MNSRLVALRALDGESPAFRRWNRACMNAAVALSATGHSDSTVLTLPATNSANGKPMTPSPATTGPMPVSQADRTVTSLRRS